MKTILTFAATVLVAAAQPPAPPKKAPPGSSLDQRRGASRVTWRTRTLVGNDRLLTWKTGPAATAFPQGTFLEAVDKTDALGLASIEASIQTLPPATDAAPVKEALRSHAVNVVGYRVDSFTADKKLFDFAKGLGAEMIIGNAAPGSLAAIDAMAAETKIKVALVTRNPKADLAAIASASKQIGLATDSSSLNVESVAAVKDR